MRIEFFRFEFKKVLIRELVLNGSTTNRRINKSAQRQIGVRSNHNGMHFNEIVSLIRLFDKI